MLASFLRFWGLSGIGWILDFCLLFIFVKFARMPVFTANMISATTAALTVFLLSRKLVFLAARDRVFLRALFYAAYTLAVIVVASLAIKYVTRGAAAVSAHFHLLLSIAACALLAKIVVTPLNFLLNFLVARFTSEHATTS